MKLKALIFACILLILGNLSNAQTFVSDLSAPAENFINQEVCWSMTFSNQGAPGYQPYVRLFVPPELPYTGISAEYIGSPITEMLDGGDFVGGIADDPFLGEMDADNLVAGPDGYRLLVLMIPVGSMVENGVSLTVDMCATINGPTAQVGVPFDIQAAMVYRYGDTPVGTNGAIVGNTLTASITPTLYTFSKAASDVHMATGSCFDFDYTLSVDIADQELVTDLIITDILPPNIQYLGWMNITPGCVIQSEPSVVNPGGTFSISCDNAVGTPDAGDITLQFAAFLTDGLDPFSCDSVQYFNVANAVSAQNAVLTSQVSSFGYHVVASTEGAGGGGVPGTVNPMVVKYFISEYVDGVDALEVSLVVPDGLIYLGNPVLNGSPVPANTMSVTGPIAGVTQLTFDLRGANGTNFTPCQQGTLTFDVAFSEQYANGDPLVARDAMLVEGLLTYSLINGVQNCALPISAGFSIESVEVSKEVVSTPMVGEVYAPGENVTYRLTMTIPSEDVKGVVFEDIFPLPIHDVAAIDLTFGNDIHWSVLDNTGITPQNIYIDAPSNRLFIDWGDITGNTSGIPRVISVDIDVAITSEPFASGLTHSNFARFFSSNSSLDNQATVTSANIIVAAPSLQIYKGVEDTNNPNEVIAPLSSPVDADVSGVDALDWITFNVTVVNEGASPAYDVIVNDFPPINYLQNCAVSTVTTATGTPVSYAGNLFTTGLVIDEIQANLAADEADEIVITYQCQVVGGVEVLDHFENQVQATWASTAGDPDRFDPVFDQAHVEIAAPEVNQFVYDIQPGYGQNGSVHIGEVVTYQIDITIPEGITRNLEISDVLPEGMAIEDILTVTADDGIGLEFTPGMIINNAQINDLGSNPENLRRHLVMTLGNVENVHSDNTDNEQIHIQYRAVVLNTAGNQSGQILTNSLSVLFNDPIANDLTFIGNTCDLTVAEPDLVVTPVVFNDQLIPGETTFITLQVSHSPSSTGTAFDVDILNDLPIGLEFVDASWILECENLMAGLPQEDFGLISAHWDSIPLGVDCQISFGVLVSEAYPPCSIIDNLTNLAWTSTWSTHMDTLSYGPVHSLGYERTGSINDVGGALNDYNGAAPYTIEVISESTVTPVISGPINACNGDDLSLSIADYQGIGVVYHWSGPGVPPGYNNNILTLYNVSASDAGDYQVFVEIGDCMTDPSQTITLAVNTVPEITVPNIDIACSNGMEDIVISAIISGGTGPFNYFWTGPAGYTSSAAVATIPNAGIDDQGIYTIYVVDDNNCVSGTASSTVAVTNSPEPAVISQPLNLCAGEPLEFTCNGYVGSVSYHWSTPLGDITTDQPTLLVENPDTLSTGEYSVWVSVNDCNTEVSVPTSVEVFPIPPTPVPMMNDNGLCEGETLTLSTEAVADEYYWIGPNGYESFLSAPPVIPNITSFEAGNYYLQTTVNGCLSELGMATLNVLVRPETPDLASNSPVCEGNELIFTTNSSAIEYVWINPMGNQIITDTPTLTVPGANASDEGNYTLMVSDGSCLSAAAPNTTAVVNSIPNVEAFGGPDVFACEDGQAILEAINDSPYSGVWTTADPTLVIVNPDSPNSNLTGAIPGETYSLTWSLYNEGCGVFSEDSVSLLTPTPPEAFEDMYSVVQGEVLDMYVLFNDAIIGQNVNVSIIEPPVYAQTEIGFNEYVIYNPDADFSGSDEFSYEICLEHCPNICSNAVVRIEVLPYLEIPDVITPNNDGSNDTFVITGLENFPSNQLCVYNRWGHEVYREDNYKNDWAGTFEGQPLPEGTYYYVFLDSSINVSLAQGFVVIHR